MNHVVYNLSDNKKKIVLMCRRLQGGGGAFRDQTTAVGAASVIHVAGRCCHQAQCKKKKKRSKGSSRWRAQWCSSRQLQQHPTLKWTEGDWSACKNLQVRHNSIQIWSDPGYGRQWISLSRSLPPPAEAVFQDADPFDWGWCSIALVAGDDYTRNGFLSRRSAIF